MTMNNLTSLTDAQLRRIDNEVFDFALAAKAPLDRVVVKVHPSVYTDLIPGTVGLSVFFHGHEPDGSDWSFLGTSLLPDGSEFEDA